MMIAKVTDYVIDGEDKTYDDVLDVKVDLSFTGPDIDVIAAYVADEVLHNFGADLKSFRILNESELVEAA